MVNTCQLLTITIKLDILQVPTLYSPNPFASYKKNHGVIKAPKINLFNKASPICKPTNKGLQYPFCVRLEIYFPTTLPESETRFDSPNVT
jgi:hypothetical protein